MFTAVFLTAVMNTPFIFSDFDPVTFALRTGVGLLVLVLGLVLQRGITVRDLSWALVVLMLYLVEVGWRRSAWSNIHSYYAVVVTFIVLFRVIRKSAARRDLFLRFWVRVGYWLSATTIAVFVVHQFISTSTDWFGFASMGTFGNYDYRFSVFGVSLVRDAFGMVLTRSQSFFAEPQQAGFYFALNVLLSSSLLGRHRQWLVLNLLAGALTFSVTFFAAMTMYWLLRSDRTRAVKWLVFVVAVPICGLLVEGPAVLDATSYSVRIDRLISAWSIVTTGGLARVLFGHGVSSVETGVSSGLLHVVVERGVIGLVLVMAMLHSCLRGRYAQILVCLVFLLALSWYVNHIYWLGVLALWAGRHQQRDARRMLKGGIVREWQYPPRGC